jgi:hypothetical protein
MNDLSRIPQLQRGGGRNLEIGRGWLLTTQAKIDEEFRRPLKGLALALMFSANSATQDRTGVTIIAAISGASDYSVPITDEGVLGEGI